MVKLVILLLMGPFIKFEVSVFEGKIFFSLKIYGKLAGLSNKFEPSMVFDPSEFEGPRFDLYICKMLISIFSWFFHTIFKDLTEQILYPKCNRMHHFASFWGGGGGGGKPPRSPIAFSLSQVGMYAKICGQHRVTLQNYKLLELCF